MVCSRGSWLDSDITLVEEAVRGFFVITAPSAASGWGLQDCLPSSLQLFRASGKKQDWKTLFSTEPWPGKSQEGTLSWHKVKPGLSISGRGKENLLLVFLGFFFFSVLKATLFLKVKSWNKTCHLPTWPVSQFPSVQIPLSCLVSSLCSTQKMF